MNLLIFIIMLSMFEANVANLSNIDSHVANDTTHYEGLHHTEPHWLPPKKYQIGDSPDHLMWFVQVSDIHISVFQDQSRITELKEFCDVTISAIQPPVVLASGDLTEGRAKNEIASGENEKEWQHYNQVLKDSNVLNKTLWLDIRGNHDNLNVPSITSENNYFTNYSVRGGEHPRSYMYQITIGSEKYSFIAIDACLEPGPRRPFNFIGVLTASEADNIAKLVQEARAQNGDYIIWFGHYPTSCIISQCSKGVRSILGRYEEGMVYLCGHLHTVGGIVRNMYTLQQEGFLELELGDWRNSRVYRLAAIDHGQFSFIDVKHREWPVALITNPKHALYAMPQKENSQSVLESTHIRVLAFSLADLKSVEVRINEGEWRPCRQVKGPLYVVEWNPKEYKTGLHLIQVRVRDEDGREKITGQPFSLDGSRLSFGILARLCLMFDISHIFQTLFGIMLIIDVVPLCILRSVHNLYRRKKMHRPRPRVKIFHCCLRKLWVLSSVDRLFFPLVLYTLYLTVGPWAVGEIIENHIGAVFAWGTVVASSYLPGAATYAYGFFQLLSFHLPLTLILAHRVDQRLYEMEKPSKKPTSVLDLLLRHTLFMLLITMQITMASFFGLAYGPIAIFLGPLRSWSVILAIFLWYQANRMPQSCLRSAAAVWSSRNLTQDNEEMEDRLRHPSSDE